MQVYIAMKVRNLHRDRVTIKVLQENEAAKVHADLMDKRATELAKRRDDQTNMLTFADIGRIDPPRLDVEVLVFHFPPFVSNKIP